MSLKKLYDFFQLILSDAGKFIDQLIDGTSPWPKRYRWLSTHIDSAWKDIRKLPSLGKAPTTTMTLVCLMTIVFFLMCTYCILTGIRIPLAVQQSNVPLHKIVIASSITGLCIGLSFGEGLRMMKHAGHLWLHAPLLAKVQTAALFMTASAGAAAMPLLTLVG